MADGQSDTTGETDEPSATSPGDGGPSAWPERLRGGSGSSGDGVGRRVSGFVTTRPWTVIVVFVLLTGVFAVGIDFGIHTINRYRKEREASADIADAMGVSARQLLVAFLIVALTTSFSFLSNVLSGQTREFGIVAAAGIVFTFFIFAVFLPAAKVAADQLREGTRVPEFGSTPLGSEGSGSTRSSSTSRTSRRTSTPGSRRP